MKKLKYRHELKHKINNVELSSTKSRLSLILKKDDNALENGGYFVRSLYFDTPEDKALVDKIDGVAVREKFRIRFYNHNTSFIRLEKKMKHNNMIAKISAPLSKEEVDMILSNDIEFLKTSYYELLKELYVKIKCERLKPKSIVDYYRYAYIFRAGNVRVTIDTDVRGLESIDLFNKNLSTKSIVEKDISVLEIKYDEFIPSFILDLVQINRNSYTSVSKYACSRLNIK